MTTDAVTWASIIQDIGLGAALALIISLQLRRVIDNGRKEREQERAAFLDYLKNDSEANREVIGELTQTLYELRGAILGSDVQDKKRPPSKLTIDRAEAMAKVRKLEEQGE